MAEMNQQTLPTIKEAPLTLAEKVKASNGLTLDELRYQRALYALKKEFVREKMAGKISGIRRGGVAAGSGSNLSPVLRLSGLAGKAFSSLNYLDYAMLGYSAFKTVRKVYRFFRPKKH